MEGEIGNLQLQLERIRSQQKSQIQSMSALWNDLEPVAAIMDFDACTDVASVQIPIDVTDATYVQSNHVDTVPHDKSVTNINDKIEIILRWT